MENSRNSSGIMAARNPDEQEETSILHSQQAEPKTTEWTDEKHSLYLKSMEATFVNQLYKSLDVIGQHSKRKDTGTGVSSGQFKVLRDGYWSKVDFQRDEANVNQEEGSGVLLANPWIRHYRCSERSPMRKFQSCGTKAPSTTTPRQRSTLSFPLWQQDYVGNSNTEVTDQNFDDEDREEETPEITHEIKRTRTSVDTTSSNDQVVPSKDIVQVDNVTENRVRPED